MGIKLYLTISGGVFGLIAALHFIRLINRWPVQVAGFDIACIAGIEFPWNRASNKWLHKEPRRLDGHDAELTLATVPERQVDCDVKRVEAG